MINALPLVPACPFWDRSVTLGKVLPNGNVYFCQHIKDKSDALESMINDMQRGTTFFLAWTGRYHTDLFSLTEENVATLAESRKSKK